MPTYLSTSAIGSAAAGEIVAVVVARTAAEARDAAELVDVDYDPLPVVVDPFKALEPGATVLLDHVDARSLGALIAFYEHRTFANAALLGINPFDQFGVELGKEMAKAVDGDGEAARIVSYIRADETPHVEYLRTALTEMRRLLGVLRAEDQDGSEAPVTSVVCCAVPSG